MYLYVFVYVSYKKYNSPNTCGTKLEVNAYVVLVYQISLFLREIDSQISELMTINTFRDSHSLSTTLTQLLPPTPEFKG